MRNSFTKHSAKNAPGRVLCSIGKAIYPIPLSPEMQDVKVYAALSNAIPLCRVYLIVQGTASRPRVGHVGGLIVVYIPTVRNKIFNHLSFICRAFVTGARIHRRAVDLIMASEPTGAGIAAVLLKWLLHTPLLLHLQGDVLRLPEGHFSLLRRTLSRFATLLVCSFADRVRCVSQSIKAEAAKAGVKAEKLAVVPSRCNILEFDPVRLRPFRQKVRDQWGLAPGPMILFVGALSVHKGVTSLVQALALLKEQEFPCGGVLVGAGDMESVLRDMAHDLKLDERIRFCGRIPHPDVPTYMAGADLLVLPSIDEGMPRVILEAMAMELPVVASRVGGIPELVQEGCTGTLVDPGNPSLLADALRNILSDPVRVREMGRRGRARVEREFSFDKGIESYRALIATLLPAGDRP